MKAWHFIGATLRDGRPIPEDGEWLLHKGPVSMCRSGLHASREPFDALTYAPGNILCLVECDSIADEDGDKLVCQKRKIIVRMDAEEMLCYFARMQALSVAHIWDAPNVVLDYLMTGDENILAAARADAWAAAREAAREAARDAARDTARDAAWAAAGDAAWAAAAAAAGYAAWDAAKAAAKGATLAAAAVTARNAAWNAAWNVAWVAARDTAWNAARVAARDAAWDAAAAAGYAAWDAAKGAAKSAALDAAWDAARTTARKDFNDLAYECFEEWL